MDEATVLRAKTILKHKEVLPCEDQTPRQLHFKVRARSGEWSDVWVQLQHGALFYSCNVIDRTRVRERIGPYGQKRKVLEPWGCVMTGKTDRSKPYCSHTKAVELYLKERGLYEKIEERAELTLDIPAARAPIGAASDGPARETEAREAHRGVEETLAARAQGHRD